MTQFLLVASTHPYSQFSNLTFSRVDEGSFLADVASVLFPSRRTSVWSVAAERKETGELAYEAREEIRAGKKVDDTTLGCLVQHAMNRQDSFALFYAADFVQLPTARAPESLLGLIDEQLRVNDGSSLELYALWREDA